MTSVFCKSSDTTIGELFVAIDSEYPAIVNAWKKKKIVNNNLFSEGLFIEFIDWVVLWNSVLKNSVISLAVYFPFGTVISNLFLWCL